MSLRNLLTATLTLSALGLVVSSSVLANETPATAGSASTAVTQVGVENGGNFQGLSLTQEAAAPSPFSFGGFLQLGNVQAPDMAAAVEGTPMQLSDGRVVTIPLQQSTRSILGLYGEASVEVVQWAGLNQAQRAMILQDLLTVPGGIDSMLVEGNFTSELGRTYVLMLIDSGRLSPEMFDTFSLLLQDDGYSYLDAAGNPTTVGEQRLALTRQAKTYTLQLRQEAARAAVEQGEAAAPLGRENQVVALKLWADLNDLRTARHQAGQDVTSLHEVMDAVRALGQEASQEGTDFNRQQGIHLTLEAFRTTFFPAPAAE